MIKTITFFFLLLLLFFEYHCSKVWGLYDFFTYTHEGIYLIKNKVK